MKNKEQFKFKYEILGWILFIVSALFFIGSSIRSGDMIGLFGGLFFLIACFIFLIPYLSSDHSG
ncbi:MAG: hypothetical protein A2277_14645 [Desulfobacterales bacterium RIFOXYA12_FULL_46_15]|nr:MAG: hypothetical protein A2277_14645 [Desulfobacterales bacterium RIFOXYA12_FULL_46_15]